MAHVLAPESESEHGVVFRCAVCSAVCEFVKPDFGSPSPTQPPEGGWLAPENPDQWMGPCTQ